MKLVSVQVGRPRTVRWRGKPVATGIYKEPVAGRIMLYRFNLDGDQQADLTVHGGPDKAVYVCPSVSFPSNSVDPLSVPVGLGALRLSHRVVMAPLTRMRTFQPGDIPGDLMATYYRQRTTPGDLIVSEATQVTPYGKGYHATPGIYKTEEGQGWRRITDAVHSVGGLMVLQLWHVGRISHSSLLPGGVQPMAPSPIAAAGQATRADGTNRRTDAYGSLVANRARLLLEVTEAVISVWSANRVGVRLSPYGTFNDMHDSDPVTLFTHAIRELSNRRIAYLHLVEPR
jgi:N-ethylmaleimide reductase